MALNTLHGLTLIPLEESVSVQIPFTGFYIVMNLGVNFCSNLGVSSQPSHRRLKKTVLIKNIVKFKAVKESIATIYHDVAYDSLFHLLPWKPTRNV